MRAMNIQGHQKIYSTTLDSEEEYHGYSESYDISHNCGL